MPELPARCTSCGRVVASGIYAEDASFELPTGATTNCPYCGGTAQVRPGHWEVQAGVMRLLSQPEWSPARLAALRRAVTAPAPPEATWRAIEREAPEVAAYVRRSMSGKDVVAWIGLVATVISALVALATFFGDGAVTEDQLREVLDESGVSEQTPEEPPGGSSGHDLPPQT